jgi:hypothetical protein
MIRPPPPCAAPQQHCQRRVPVRGAEEGRQGSQNIKSGLSVCQALWRLGCGTGCRKNLALGQSELLHV